MSLRMASYLHVSQAPTLKHWAASKIRNAPPKGHDAETTETIVQRLKGQSEVSCADVAQTAWEVGQNKLASRLLEHEVKASKQVPLLIKMKEDVEALNKALQSNDPDLSGWRLFFGLEHFSDAAVAQSILCSCTSNEHMGQPTFSALLIGAPTLFHCSRYGRKSMLSSSCGTSTIKTIGEQTLLC